jgi:hypothetical protein
MALIAAIWQNLVWCGMIGGVIGLVLWVIARLWPTPGHPPPAVIPDLVFNTLGGTLFGLILLGVSASLWVVGKWVFHDRKTVPASEARRFAAVGSAAAIPLTLAGAAGGFLLCLIIVSIVTLTPWAESLAKPAVRHWYIAATVIGGLIGFLTGTFLGSAIGALIAGLHAIFRRRPE